ncbi:MAG TPA: M20/M25/M40 family metallo-hydrolase, partial [Allosphingosinicella sp.]
ALLVCAMGLKGWLVRLPEPAPAAAGAFDSQRALARLAFVLGDQRPHPVDSAANDAVRSRLMQQMRSLGLEPQVTDDIACNGSKSWPSISCARVRNVFATMGPAQGEHLMLASHYDSSPVGPGAADDGIGMAVMLETAAQLRGRKQARPVTFLFTDGEEAGLLGAGAFLDKNPLANRVGTVLNFEARGVTGPAIMFETSAPDGPAIALYKVSVDRPAANSLTVDVAKLIPNSTDVEVFKAKRDWTILNFAVIGNETRYHSPGDNLAALDRRSVQHMGDQALALAGRIAAGEQATASGEHAYADLLGRGLVLMPLWASLVVLALLAMAFVVVAWRGRRGVGRPLMAVIAAIAGAAGLAWVGQNAVSLLRAGEYWRGYPEVTGLAVYISVVLAGLVSLTLIARRSESNLLRAAFWLVFLIVGGGLCAVAPGASIFFLLPPLVMGAGMLLERRRPGAERTAAIIAFLLLFLSWAPLLHLSEALLDFDAAWIFAVVGAIVLLPALIELKSLADELPGPAALAGAAAVFVAGWAAAALVPAYSPDRKQAFGIEYLWDESRGKAHWLVVNDGAPLPKALTAAAGTFRKDIEVPYSGRKRWAAPATATTPVARVTKISETAAGAGRRVRISISAPAMDSVVLKAPAEAKLLAMATAGSEHRFGKGAEDAPAYIRCQGRSCDGMVIDLLI